MSDFEMYIPPQGLYFRLFGYASQHVLFSRTYAKPRVFHHPVREVFNDQFFTLVPGTGAREGLYLIKSKQTNKVLFSRRYRNPHVGHKGGNGKHNYNWFKLEPGQGKFADMFRIICPATNTAVFTRTHTDSRVGNYKPASKVYSDHYFSFLFEDTEVVRVEYDLKLGKIVNATLKVLATQTLINNTKRDQEMSFNLNETETHTSTWEYSTGFTISVGASFKAHIPVIAGTQFKSEASDRNDWKWGNANSFTKSWTANFPTKAGPWETIRAVSTVTRGRLEVPYTIVLRSKANGVEVKTKGMWRGVSSCDFRHTVTAVETKEDQVAM